MKKGCTLSGFFWGVFLVLLGTSVILNAVYHINLPVYKIFFGLLIIAFGLQMLLGVLCRRKDTDPVEDGVVQANERRKDYNVMFGRGTIDLRSLRVGDNNLRVEVNIAFGAATLRLNPEVPALIHANTAFGGVRMPDANNAAFGTYVYTTKRYDENAPHLVIDATVVLGGLDIVE